MGGSFRKDGDHLSSAYMFNGSVSVNNNSFISSIGSSCLMGGFGRIVGNRSGESYSLSLIQSLYKGLFSGFVRNVGASCVDTKVENESISLNGVYGGVGVCGVNEDELTFDLEDSFVESDVEPYAKELFLGAQP